VAGAGVRLGGAAAGLVVGVVRPGVGDLGAKLGFGDGDLDTDDGPGGTAGRVVGSDAPASRNCSTDTRELSSGVAVRRTGSIATDARATLVNVAAHHPSTGTQLRRDRIRPWCHFDLGYGAWR
jgi:hypothetical protein